MKRLKILLVDDEPETGAALGAWLARRGYDAVYANGPQEADAALAIHTFDVVLSDIQMPGNNRLEWIEQRLRVECPPPVLLMTGDPKLETAIGAVNLSVAGYLIKPLDYDRTADLIEQLAAEQRYRLEVLSVSRDLTAVLSQHDLAGSTLDPLLQHVAELALKMGATIQRAPRLPAGTDRTAPWRDAVLEAVLVLEKTKHSFRSKELGELRQRLQRLLTATSKRELRPTCDATTG